MLVLGSSSPRRIQLLQEITKDFVIQKPSFDESTIPLSTPHFALVQALNKAKSLKTAVNPNDILLTCDTVVILDGKIFGKPKDIKDAINMLSLLSGKTHIVETGYVIMMGDKIIQKEVQSLVTFNVLSPETIKNYVEKENVLDKAGAYAIQDDEKFHLINKIKGSRNNIIGFPIEDIRKDLQLFNIF